MGLSVKGMPSKGVKVRISCSKDKAVVRIITTISWPQVSHNAQDIVSFQVKNTICSVTGATFL
jgi:hypothetical protein